MVSIVAENETIIESLTDAVYVLNEEGRFTYVNDQFVALVGYDRQRILGSRPSLIKDEEAVERAEHQLGRVLSSDGPETVMFEVTVKPREAEPIVCEDRMGVIPYDGDQFNGSVGALRDISERKEREQQIADQRDDLELLGQVLRHDLRNDLQVVIGRLDVLSDHVDEDGESILQNAHESTRDAIDLTTTARKMAEVILTEETETRQVNLQPILTDVIDDINSAYPDANVTIEGEIPQVTVTATELLDSVFDNILSNAIQHNNKAMAVGSPSLPANTTRRL